MKRFLVTAWLAKRKRKMIHQKCGRAAKPGQLQPVEGALDDNLEVRLESKKQRGDEIKLITNLLLKMNG